MMKRRQITVQGPEGTEPVELEAWEEHGAWYVPGHADEIGALYAPMMSDGTLPTWDELCEIEVRYADA